MTFDAADYERIWQAPEGCDYAIQYRRPDVREFHTYEMAVALQEARAVFNEIQGTLPQGAEVRLVTLSRYPPCSVSKVILYTEVK